MNNKAVNPTATHSLCSHKGKPCYRTRSFCGCRRQSGPPAQSYADTCRRPEQRDKWPRGHKSGPIWPPAGPHTPVVELRVRSRSPPPLSKNRRTVRESRRHSITQPRHITDLWTSVSDTVLDHRSGTSGIFVSPPHRT